MLGLHFGDALFLYKCLLLFENRQLTNTNSYDIILLLKFPMFCASNQKCPNITMPEATVPQAFFAF